MDQHLGASITLSFALVVVFAIVFYQPEHETIPRAGPEVSAPRPEPPVPEVKAVAEASVPAPAPPLTPGEPLAAGVAIVPVSRVKRPVAAAELVPERPKAQPPRPPLPVGKPPAAPVLPPRDGFTQTRQGESLRDVAIRVYGSADEADSLWRLNRDLIRRREGVLPTGTLLRTP